MPAAFHPPFSFWRPKKRMGGGRSKRKNTRGERACRIPGKSLPAAWIAREWEIGDVPVSFFRCRFLGAPGQRQRNKKRRVSGRSKPTRSPRRGQRLSGLLPSPPPRNIFSFPPCTAHFLFDVSKRKWGVHSCRQSRPSPRPLIGNQENVTTVPVFPSRASRHLSRLVMMARRPGLVRTNFMAAWTLGSMLPTPNWPSAAYRAASARLR